MKSEKEINDAIKKLDDPLFIVNAAVVATLKWVLSNDKHSLHKIIQDVVDE